MYMYQIRYGYFPLGAMWLLRLVFLLMVIITSFMYVIITLVNVYVDLVVFTRIAGTLKTGSGRYWP